MTPRTRLSLLLTLVLPTVDLDEPPMILAMIPSDIEGRPEIMHIRPVHVDLALILRLLLQVALA